MFRLASNYVAICVNMLMTSVMCFEGLDKRSSCRIMHECGICNCRTDATLALPNIFHAMQCGGMYWTGPTMCADGLACMKVRFACPYPLPESAARSSTNMAKVFCSLVRMLIASLLPNGCSHGHMNVHQVLNLNECALDMYICSSVSAS